MNDIAIRLQGVRKAFEGHVAVHELSLDVPKGCVFGLLGPNGAGKTTTLRMVMDIIGPDAGTIDILGRPADRSARDCIGYMPEERGLYARMQVGEQLLYLAELKGCARADAQKRLRPWLERLGLGDWEKRKLNELSKGMQQKTQFVATVLHDPEILILDEPMSGLDPVGMNLMKDVLVEMSRAGKTLILSSHQMETVEKMCDRVALIHRGRKVLDGTVAEVKKQHGQNAVVMAFEGDGRFLETQPGVASVNHFNNYVELRLSPGADPQALLKAAAEKLRLSRFELVEPSLHDIFVEKVTAAGETLPGEVAGGKV